MKDVVNHPEHYNSDSPYECIKVLRNWMSPSEFNGFLRGNILKYLCRSEKKNGIEDLQKAQWYLKYLIMEESNALEGTTTRITGTDYN